ncbi:glycerophosphodiester phosphodiesterase [Desulforhopalus sp. 52FAK]
MILIGHRGCFYPGYNQNTIRAFDKVAKEGVPAIEFDVQLCGDGELVIVHNLDLEEVSNGTGQVSSTTSKELKTLYAGDPARGKDRIPFLAEVLDFFASLAPHDRPIIHLELKGDGTGRPTGAMVKEYLADGRLLHDGVLVSSFNWQELESIRTIIPTLQIALLEGAIRRKVLLEKAPIGAESYFERVFSYGCEQYMLPRFINLTENLELLEQECSDPHLREIFSAEIESCLLGKNYNDELLSTACEMKAVSVNLWHQTVAKEFVDKAHSKGLAVQVYTANAPEELKALSLMGVDGIFTDYYSEAAATLAGFTKPQS